MTITEEEFSEVRTTIPSPRTSRGMLSHLNSFEAHRNRNFESDAHGLIGDFVLLAGIAENAEIIADFHALRSAEIDVNDVIGAVSNLEMFAGDEHGLGLAARRGESIEFIFGLERRRRALGERNSNIAALQVFAGIFDLHDGAVGLHDDDLHAAFIFPERADGLHDRELPFEPARFRGFFHRANDAEFVADVDALALAFIEIDEVAFLEGKSCSPNLPR